MVSTRCSAPSTRHIMMRRRTILAEEELKDGGIIVTRLLPVRIHHRHLVQIRQQRLNEWRVRRCKRNSRGSASRCHCQELTARFLWIFGIRSVCVPQPEVVGPWRERERGGGGVYHSLLAVEYRNPSLSSNRISRKLFFWPTFFQQQPPPSLGSPPSSEALPEALPGSVSRKSDGRSRILCTTSRKTWRGRGRGRQRGEREREREREGSEGDETSSSYTNVRGVRHTDSRCHPTFTTSASLSLSLALSLVATTYALNPLLRLRTALNKHHALRSRPVHRLATLHLSPRRLRLVLLVSNQQLHHILPTSRAVQLHLLQPRLEVVKGVATRHVVAQNDALRSAIVRRSQRPKALLPEEREREYNWHGEESRVQNQRCAHGCSSSSSATNT